MRKKPIDRRAGRTHDDGGVVKVRRATIGLAWGLLLAAGGCLDVPDASESADTGIVVDNGDDDGGADRDSTGTGDGGGDGADANKLDLGGGGVSLDVGGGRDDSTGTDTGTSSGTETGFDTETGTTAGTDTGTDSGSSSTG
jgi:hypothetical protein